MVDFKTTMRYLKADFDRRALLEQRKGFFDKFFMLFARGMVGVTCYRLSRYFVSNKLGVLYRILVMVEHLYPKNEISPMADIGPGLVLSDTGAMGIPSNTVIGKNCTMMGSNTLTLGAIEGINPEVDQIVMGDHCVLGSRAKVMRAITLADGTQILDNSLAMFSLQKSGTLIAGVPAKRVRRVDYQEVVEWNPIRSCRLAMGEE